jgi:hypothetical protein
LTPAAGRPTIDAMPHLQAFLQRVERQRGEDLLPRAARPLDESAHADALAAATEAARAGGLEAEVTHARETVDRWVIELFNSSHLPLGWWEANWGRPGTTADRANLAQSLGEAVTAVILGDRLDPGHRDELLGAWADLVPDA